MVLNYIQKMFSLYKQLEAKNNMNKNDLLKAMVQGIIVENVDYIRIETIVEKENYTKTILIPLTENFFQFIEMTHNVEEQTFQQLDCLINTPMFAMILINDSNKQNVEVSNIILNVKSYKPFDDDQKKIINQTMTDFINKYQDTYFGSKKGNNYVIIRRRLCKKNKETNTITFNIKKNKIECKTVKKEWLKNEINPKEPVKLYTDKELYKLIKNWETKTKQANNY